MERVANPWREIPSLGSNPSASDKWVRGAVASIMVSKTIDEGSSPSGPE